MKTSALVVAALLATASGAFASDAAANLQFPGRSAETVQATEALDLKATGSIKRAVPADENLNHSAVQSLAQDARTLGIDVSPWMMPTFH